MNSQTLINYAAQVLKEYSVQSGYSIPAIIGIAKPMIFEIAADKGVKLHISDLNSLEELLITLDKSSNVVSFSGRKKRESEKQIDYIEIRTQLQDLLEKIILQAIPNLEDLPPRAKSNGWANQYKTTADGSFAGFLRSKLKIS